MRASLFALFACITLAACTSTPSSTTLADGSVAYRIDCDSSREGLNRCFEKAGKSCGADGYVVVNAQGERLSNSSVAEGDTDSMMRLFETATNSILIRCGTD